MSYVGPEMRGRGAKTTSLVADNGQGDLVVKLPSQGNLLAVGLTAQSACPRVLGRIDYITGPAMKQHLNVGYMRTIGGRVIEGVMWTGRIRLDEDYENEVNALLWNLSGDALPFRLHAFWEVPIHG